MRGQWRNKRDANEPEIVAELCAYGFSVVHLDQPVDLLIGKHGRTWIAEVKIEGGKLNQKQAAFFEEWRGNKTILRSVEDVAEFYHMTQGADK
jgi:hypothetical protein